MVSEDMSSPKWRPDDGLPGHRSNRTFNIKSRGSSTHFLTARSADEAVLAVVLDSNQLE